MPICVVLNKPPGMVVHPAPGHSGGTLANALLYRYPEIRGVGGIESRSGIVHRLDKDTSGVMLAARHRARIPGTVAAIQNRLVRKTYQGFVYGIPAKEGAAITLPVGRHPGTSEKNDGPSIRPIRGMRKPDGR
jgi:23S rRNA pseudouridine1911/1915/1917 synthase